MHQNCRPGILTHLVAPGRQGLTRRMARVMRPGLFRFIILPALATTGMNALAGVVEDDFVLDQGFYPNFLK